MKSHRLALPAALALSSFTLLIAPAAHAQSTPAKKELAARVAKLEQPAIDAIAANIARETAQRVLSATGQALLLVPQDKREATDKQVSAEVKAFYDDVAMRLRDSATKVAPQALATYLEEKFSEDELKQIAAWLESPVAKKFQQVGGEMQGLVLQKLVEDTKPAIEPKLKALEDSLKKRFAAVTPPPQAASGAAAAKPAAKPASPKASGPAK